MKEDQSERDSKNKIDMMIYFITQCRVQNNKDQVILGRKLLNNVQSVKFMFQL